jgi:putative hydrolase of the HAD superfamily
VTGIRAVSFDASGTLITVAEQVGTTYARFAAAAGIDADPADIEMRFRAALEHAVPLAFPVLPAPAREARERAWWRRIVRAALGRLDGDARIDACGDALFDHYARAAAWRVYPEVAMVLAALRTRGFPLAVVSNFDGRLPPLLAALGIAPLIDRIVYSSAAGTAKPDPGMLVMVAESFGLPTSGLLHVGDTPLDLAAAHAAGARGAALDRRPGRRDTIGSLEPLLDLLQGPQP